MELLYAFIGKQGVLKNIGLRFSPYYNVKFNERERILSISQNKTFPSDFFDDSIVSITGIIGNNGAGKSTAIYWLLRAFVDGSGEKEPDGIILLKDDYDRLIVYAGKNFNDIQIKADGNLQKPILSDGRFEHHIPCCYYSGHFLPFIRLDVDSGELSGETNISDKWLLIKDYQNFTAEDGLHLHHTLGEHLNAYLIQNAQRITYFLMNKPNRDKIEAENLMRLPDYILITPNNSGRYKLDGMKASEKSGQLPANFSDKLLNRHVKYPDRPSELVNRFIEESFINYIAENLVASEDTIKQFNNWIKFPSGDDAVEDLKNYIQKYDYQDEFFLSNLLKTINLIRSICSINVETPNPFFYVAVDDAEQLYRFYDELLHSTVFLTGRFFDISYSKDIYTLTKLSSGELELLNLLSRIYWYLAVEVIKILGCSV